MADYRELREMQNTYLAASKKQTQWSGEKALALAEQVSILAGHLADSMLPIPPQPPSNDEHVAIGCMLFSDPSIVKQPV